jgi:kynureninase
MKNLIDYRVEFDSIKHCHYLISNSLGAMPNAARQAASEFVDLWADRGVRAWEEKWWLLSRVVGDKIAGLINAPPDSVSMHPNVTSAQAALLSSLDFDSPRNKVVMVDIEFPSLLYLYGQWLREQGRLEIVTCPDGMTVPTEKLLDAIDETTLLVPISSVLFRSACIIDAAAIIEKAHRVGAMVLLDIFQAVGTLPVDVTSLQTDFAVGGCLKWLCGGPGASYLYVKPELAGTLEPRFTGWLAHESPFAFDRGPMRYTSGSYRFMNGTPVIPSLYTCQPGLDMIAEIGVERIRARSVEMTTLLMDQAAARGWATFAPNDPTQRAGTVALNLGSAQAITTELLKRNFLVDYRPEAGIRVSPHFYNTDQEIDDLFMEIEGIMGEMGKG